MKKQEMFDLIAQTGSLKNEYETAEAIQLRMMRKGYEISVNAIRIRLKKLQKKGFVDMTSICPSGKTDTYTVAVTGKQMQECTPNQKGCSADRTKVIICNSAGLQYVDFQTCPEGQVCEGNACVTVGVCGNNKCESGETVTCPQDCTSRKERLPKGERKQN